MKRFEKVYTQGTIDLVEIWLDKETGVSYLFHKNANFFERLQHSAKFFRQCPSFLPIVYKKW